jgi:hypothetical protein
VAPSSDNVHVFTGSLQLQRSGEIEFRFEGGGIPEYLFEAGMENGTAVSFVMSAHEH